MPYSNANKNSFHRRSAVAPDGRIVLYRWLRRLGGLLLVAGGVKLIGCDTMVISTEQMSPDLLPGDRVVVWRLPFRLGMTSSLKRGSAVVVSMRPFADKYVTLRVAGLAADTVELDSGKLRINAGEAIWGMPLRLDVLPPEYSPRDFLPAFRVPRAGDSINLSMVNMRDFFFLSQAIQRENPRETCRIRPRLQIDTQPVTDYHVDDFSLYRGNLDSVPAAQAFDWFFWDRAIAYLRAKHSGRTIDCTFTLERNGRPVTDYTFRESCIFLLADDWESGYDSRYFGPVPLSRIRGTAAMIAWSFDKIDSRWPGKPRINRVGKFVRTRRMFRGKG